MKFKKIENSNYQKLVETLTFKEVEIILNKNRIINERVEIINTFIINLCYNAITTYFGRDFLKTNNDISSHYKWAYNKTINQFIEQDIDFSKNVEIFDYFFEYFIVSLYNNEEFHESHILNYWFSLFDMKQKNKYRLDVNSYIDIYSMFNQIFINKLYE